MTERKMIYLDDAIEAIEEERFPIDSDYAEGFMAAIDKVEWVLKEWMPSAQPEHEYTMEEFVYGQDMGNPEDGSL